MLSKSELQELKDYYNYKSGGNYTSQMHKAIEKALKNDFNNIFLFADEYWGNEVVDRLNAKDLNDYVNLAIERKNGVDIYNCAKHLNKKYPKYVQPLLDAVLESKSPEGMALFAMLVNNINRKQFLTLVDAVVKTRDAEAIVELANNSQGYRTCAEGFYILDEFIDMVVKQNDEDLVSDIINMINKKEDYTRGKPSYAIPLGHAVTTEQIKFADVLYDRFTKHQVENGDVLGSIDDEYYKD